MSDELVSLAHAGAELAAFPEALASEIERAERAEADNARLREALRDLRKIADESAGVIASHWLIKQIDVALAGGQATIVAHANDDDETRAALEDVAQAAARRLGRDRADELAEKVRETHIYVSPVHASVVRDSEDALKELVALAAAPTDPDCEHCRGVGAMAGCHLDRVNPCPYCGGTGRLSIQLAQNQA